MGGVYGSGELTQEQMRVGFDSHEDFHQVMESLEVTADDLEIVWTLEHSTDLLRTYTG